MRSYLTKKEFLEQLQQENASIQRASMQEAGKRAVEKALGRSLNETEKPLVKSLTGRAMGEKAGSLRPGLKEPPNGMCWGGSVSTDRDAEYCICGLKITEHDKTPPGHYCPFVVNTGK